MLREQGHKAGIVHIRLWRPFPYDEIQKHLGKAKTVLVFDRSLSPGGPGGPVVSEIRNALYHLQPRPNVVGAVGALGGRDFRAKMFADLLLDAEAKSKSGNIPPYEMVGVRE